MPNKLLKLHPEHKHPVVIPELDVIIDNQQEVLIDEAIIAECPIITCGIDNNILSMVDELGENGYSIIDPFYYIATKNNPVFRDMAWLTNKREEERKRQEAIDAEKAKQRELAGFGVEEDFVSFCNNAKVTCKLGFGIAIFDSDLPSSPNAFLTCDGFTTISEYICCEITKDQEVLDFAKSHDVIFDEWIAEDCRQLWIVDAKSYVQTSHSEIVDRQIRSYSIRGVMKVYYMISKKIREKFGVAMPKRKPEWMLHLYYR